MTGVQTCALPISVEHALEELATLQHSLIGHADAISPRLLRCARGWEPLLCAEHARLQRLAAEEGEIPQVFIAGNGLNEEQHRLFVGRQDVLKELESALLQSATPPAVLLHGPRRVGKTSVLKQLPRMMGADCAPCLVDAQEPGVTTSPAGFCLALSRALVVGLERRGTTLKPLPLERLETETFLTFGEWLREAEAALPGRTRALLDRKSVV